MDWGFFPLFDLLSGIGQMVHACAETSHDVYSTEKQKAHRDLLLHELPNARLRECLGKKEGTIAYDHVLDRFGVALGSRPASFFGPPEIVDVHINPSNDHLVFLTAKQWGQERDFVLRFDSKATASRWNALLEERMCSCFPAGIRGPRIL